MQLRLSPHPPILCPNVASHIHIVNCGHDDEESIGDDEPFKRDVRRWGGRADGEGERAPNCANDHKKMQLIYMEGQKLPIFTSTHTHTHYYLNVILDSTLTHRRLTCHCDSLRVQLPLLITGPAETPTTKSLFLYFYLSIFIYLFTRPQLIFVNFTCNYCETY